MRPTPPPATSTALRTLRASLAGLALLSGGCGISPWEQEFLPSGPREPQGERRFVAASASLGEWVDRRPSGSVIRHGMLVLDDPSLEEGPRAGRSVVVVMLPAGPLYDKVADVVSDRIPVMADMRTNFATGVVTPVRIERVHSNGVREPIAEGRASFLEIVRR
jgi:hypothetical protein